MHIAESAYLIKISKVFLKLGSSERGISIREATDRLKELGYNKIISKRKTNPLIIFIKQFKSPLVYILIFAGIISLILGEITNSIVILIAIILDVVVGFIQEFRASSALEALFEKTVLTTAVIRSGQMFLINAAELVPGDVIDLKRGDKIPADARIIEQRNLEVDESTLTGESFPRKKISKKIPHKRVIAERDNMIYMGTDLVSGTCRALVTATGQNTELGKISKTIYEAREEKTLIQKELDSLARFLGISLSLIVSIIFLIGIFRGYDFSQLFSESVALVVSAIPEGLPVSITIIFAIGMQKILKKHGLVRKLLATEVLGRTEILCVDKTGTLTEGRMNVTKISVFDEEIIINSSDFSESDTTREIIKAATLCNNAFVEKNNGLIFRGNPTDIALLKLGHKFNITKKAIDKRNPILDSYPFDQNLKLSATLIKNSENNRLYICGAPEVIIRNSTFFKKYKSVPAGTNKFSEKEKQKMISENESLCSKGFRVLGVAYKDVYSSKNKIDSKFKDLIFLGLIVISDPLRKSAKETVENAIEAGLRLVIVTGDHLNTAVNIARQVGLPCKAHNVIEGNDLERLSDQELYNLVENIYVFARVSPSDKVRIIKVWKKKGKIVAMTGDGVNDAPALHLADIGVALGSGTDVAKEGADIVLLKDDLKTILDVIEEGRGILDNIKKVVLYLLSDGLAEVTLVGFAIFLGWPLPILATQILWVNLVEDGLPDIALALEPIKSKILKIPPEVFKRAILDRELKVFVFIFGWIDDIALIGLFTYFYLNGYDIDFIRTMVFGALTIDSLFFAYSCKSLREPLWKINILNNKLLNIAFIIGIILLVGAIYLPPLQLLLSTVPLNFNNWILLLSVGILDLITLELVKLFFIRRGFWR